MRTRMIVTTLTAAAALTLTLSACSSSGGSTTAAAPSQSSSAAAQPAPAGSASTPAGSASAPAGADASASKPAGAAGAADAAKKLALIGGLKQIDPNLAKDQEHAVVQAQLTCAEIKSGKDDATVAKDTAANFSSGGTALTPQQGQMIAVMVKAAFCP